MNDRRGPVAENDIAAFERDGVVCLRGPFDDDWLYVIEAGMEQNFHNPGKHAHFYAHDDSGHV